MQEENVREISPEDAKYIDPNQVTSMRLSDGTKVVVTKSETKEEFKEEKGKAKGKGKLCPVHSKMSKKTETSYVARSAPARTTNYREEYEETTNERGNYGQIVEERHNYELYESGFSNKLRGAKKVEEVQEEEYCTCGQEEVCPCCGKLKKQTTDYEAVVVRSRPEPKHCPKCHKDILDSEYREETTTTTLRAAQPRTQTVTRTTTEKYSSKTTPLRTSQTKTFISEYVQPKYVYANQELPTRTHQATTCRDSNCQYCGRPIA